MINKLLQPSDSELRRAYEEFRSLLAGPTVEADWQQFFRDNPFVLSRSLPLRLDPREIIPCGTPGKSEADFIFYQRTGGTVSAYGTIELKRPDSKILTFPRKDIVLLTRDADTAMKQAEKYANSLVLPNDILILGSAQYLFVIMGLSSELTLAFGRDVIRAEMDRLLPRGCQLLPYDTLLQRFESTLSNPCVVLVPALPTDEELVSSAEVADTLRRDALQRLLSDDIFFKKLRALVLRLSLHRTPHHYMTADDIVQEIVLRLWRHPPETENIWPWVAVVARRLVMDYSRRARHVSFLDEEIESTLSERVRYLSTQGTFTENKRINAGKARVQADQKGGPRRRYRRKTP